MMIFFLDANTIILFMSEIQSKPPLYIDVALPVPIRGTFIYRLPAESQSALMPGLRVLVPFGTRRLIGYIVAYHDRIEDICDVSVDSIKDAIKVLDNETLVNEEILKLTKWAADYYLTSWGELLKASLPAGLNSKVERIIIVNDQSIEEIRQFLEKKPNENPETKVLRILLEEKKIYLEQLYSEFNQRKINKLIAEFQKNGWIEILTNVPRSFAKARTKKFVRLTKLYDESVKLTAAQQRIISTLLNFGELSYTDLMEQTGVSASVIKTLEKKGFLEIVAREVPRDSFGEERFEPIQDIALTEAQVCAFNEIKNALECEAYRTFLLHGVTGSGKTAVYVAAIREAIKLNRTSLVLVPEIALTPRLSEYLLATFGPEVAILHSSLTARERFDEWQRIRAGKAKIVIGTRSAIFAPLKRLGLIIVDEEHDSSYRQQDLPPYNARDLAIVRGKIANAIVILGSATPSLESFHNAKAGKYTYLHLPERVQNRSLADVEVIDMRKVFEREGKVVISQRLISAIKENAARREQSIILINRRGFSQFILCLRCGEAIRCKNCDITLTYHKKNNSLNCHYCNFQIPKPSACPLCRSEKLNFIGEGTEKVEELLRRYFSNLRIERLDRDAVQKRETLERILRDFADGKIDMLVGTQMVSKGHDFPKVTLVGVISVDNILALPDFRASEKAFQLLTQVAGRAGRGERKGLVIIQTFHPEHYSIKFASEQNYEKFYQKESEFRKKLLYPPFSALACVLIQHRDYKHAFKTALDFKQCLDEANKQKHVKVMDISVAPMARLKGKYRLQILVKSKSRRNLHQVMELAIAKAQESRCDLRSINIEIDPATLI